MLPSSPTVHVWSSRAPGTGPPTSRSAHVPDSGTSPEGGGAVVPAEPGAVVAVGWPPSGPSVTEAPLGRGVGTGSAGVHPIEKIVASTTASAARIRGRAIRAPTGRQAAR